MHSRLYQVKSLIRLALPVLAAQLAQTMMGFIDTVMAGRVSASDMAAVAIGTSIWLPTILFFAGILMALTPMVAHLHGAKQEQKIRPLVHQGIYMALLCGVIAMGVFSQANWVLAQMDLEPQLFALSQGYIEAVLWGAPPFLLFQVLRNFSEGLSWTLPSMIIGFIGLAVNIPANYVMIYGHLGFPAMGGAGCGVATAIVFWAMFLSMAAYVAWAKKFRHMKMFSQWGKVDGDTQKAIFGLGLPIALALFFEVTLFAIVAVAIAPLGAITVAGHQVAANFSGLVFMLPLALGMAVTIRVGYYLGQDKPETAALVARLGLQVGLVIALITASFTVLARDAIAQLYSSDPAVLLLAGQLMFLCAIYQFSDTVQVVAAASLRGYKDTTALLWISLFSYWGVGLSTGLVLGLTDWLVAPMGAAGFWIGFISGLSTAALLLKWRLVVIQRRLRLAAELAH
ncbi:MULTISPECIES: MATE family efflux transporter [Ferrimonas]|uniref:MATE family efflux transporter n=1 Tax=Ferrimonas TaxID=44011 RepID=UPI0004096A68|nr:MULTISPECIES: MATE family efflux transporter [Ferrimonas]USD35659.1 MATE family efflux transporter [Ferrimonas sp. SCSIO 43195]